MSFYFAPLEGITGYIFRNAYNEYFGEGIDKFYAPFIMPHVKRAFSNKELNEILPENNSNINLVPQILTDNAEDFTRLKNEFRSMGYEEINLNLGCPSGTVTAKGRGAAMLGDLNKLDQFLDEIFKTGDENISIKTRIGVSEVDEFEKLYKVYIKYPIKELIVHPRVMEEMYRGKAHRDVFFDVTKDSPIPLCYNGDIFTKEDYEEILTRCNDSGNSIEMVNIMLGRGLLKNPTLVQVIMGMDTADSKEINTRTYNMLCKLKKDYSLVFSGQTPVLFKLKEIWSYLATGIAEGNKLNKKVMKSKSLEEFDTYIRMILL